MIRGSGAVTGIVCLGFGGWVRGWYWSGWGAAAVWGSGFEVFVEAAGPVLVEAGVAAGALMPSVA